jgi:DNA repair protein SbcC/Rad50
MSLTRPRWGWRQTFADRLFIDEGFGSLDADGPEVAIDALETLQSQGRNVGAMKDRIPVQIQIVKQGAGSSTVRICGPSDSVCSPISWGFAPP